MNERSRYAQSLRRGSGDSMYTRKAHATREAPWRGQSNDQLEAREGQAGRFGVAERFVVPLKSGNAGGGKGPQFKTDAIRGEGPGRLGNLSTPARVQDPQMASHAKTGREVLSESRMREICMSGCVSSEGWRVQQEVDLPGQQSGAP